MKHQDPHAQRDLGTGTGATAPSDGRDAGVREAGTAASLHAARRAVGPSDLTRLDTLNALLTTLNDPRASAGSVARHVAGLEVLAARIEDRYLQRRGGRAPGLAEQIALLGNRELESLLLGYLEDVVSLHSDLAIRDESEAGA